MLTANRWKDYELLDASDGEKLERWGDYILVRPDPQVIWSTGHDHPGWKEKNAHYHRSAKGGGEWEFFDLPEEWSISYELPEEVCAKLSFNLKPFAFKHTGIFPEQAANWDALGRVVHSAAASGEAPRILNLFAYTGGASCALAAAGGHVTHVDAAKGMVQWAKENAESCGIPTERMRWIVDDCLKFVERELRRGKVYDGILMDPPSYGRGPKGEVWKLEDCVWELVCKASELLSSTPLFFLINSYTTGLQPGVLSYMLESAIAGKRGGEVSADELGLPVSGSSKILPCGARGIVLFSR
ncbi:MAG: class I SAM-dependent methyltransferase [Lachnospiraceae bacterium]|nr:class I SAM-dependent methyltransferase [Lachnospiraceae bacterium]